MFCFEMTLDGQKTVPKKLYSGLKNQVWKQAHK